MTKPNCHQSYTQQRPATLEELEALVKECYPAVQDEINRLVRLAQNRGMTKHGVRYTENVARETVLRLIAATGGEILEMTL